MPSVVTSFFLLFFALFFLLKHFITFWTKWCGPTLFYLINVAKYVLVFGQNDGKFCRPVHTSWNSNLFVIYIFIYIYVHVINKFFLKKCRFKKTRFSALIPPGNLFSQIFDILWGYVTSIFRAEMSNCHISHKNVTMDCNISRKQ